MTNLDALLNTAVYLYSMSRDFSYSIVVIVLHNLRNVTVIKTEEYASVTVSHYFAIIFILFY